MQQQPISHHQVIDGSEFFGSDNAKVWEVGLHQEAH